MFHFDIDIIHLCRKDKADDDGLFLLTLT